MAKPADLGDSGSALWDRIASEYDLRPDELRVLEDACRETDLVDLMQASMTAAVASGDLLVKGSQGQPVANPLVPELRQHRATVQRLLTSLHLPDEGRSAASRSEAARRAANARWGNTG